MIKVTGGTLRGRVLPAPIPAGVRPTSSRTREALFSILGQDLAGCSFLDLFSGAAVIAIEAASRGAGPVVAVDRAQVSLSAMHTNVAAVGAAVEIVMGDVSRLGERVLPADIVYLDPPFADEIGGWIAKVGHLAKEVLVAEARTGAEFPAFAGDLPLDRVRKYGESSVGVYRR